MGLQPFVFLLVVAGSLGMAHRSFRRIRHNIRLGRETVPETAPDPAQAWRNVLLLAFGQRKMFKKWWPAVLHLTIYAAFLLTQVELLEIFTDGITGRHRVFASGLGSFYPFLISFIEVLSLLALMATLVFLYRRNIRTVYRFRQPEMAGWPRKDGNLILLGEILLIAGIFSMNGADMVLQARQVPGYPLTGGFAVSGWLGPALFGGLPVDVLVLVERTGWWLHLLTVLAFLNYLPLSKHLHILLAFPNTFLARQAPQGNVRNMPDIQREVTAMLFPEQAGTQQVQVAENGKDPVFGARDIFDLDRKNLLDAYTCTECGRCTAACPANLTGKKLSPRKIMMDVRDRMEEVGRHLDSRSGQEARPADAYDDGKSLFDYISAEELQACTTCQACVEACPVMINPLDIILQLRRHQILMESAGPADWLPLFNSLENSQAAWSVPTPRDAWRTTVEVD
ncbi:MAG: hypothetical protein RLY31_2791 [Bacteroidota bacterium]